MLDVPSSSSSPGPGRRCGDDSRSDCSGGCLSYFVVLEWLHGAFVLSAY